MDFSFRKKNTNTGRYCSVYFLPNKLTLCQMMHTNNQLPQIIELESRETTPETLPLLLQDIAKKQALKNIPCTWILHPDDYQIFILDKPDIPEAEIPAALRWQVKDLISYSPNEAAVTYITAPSHHAATEKIFAAVARLPLLEEKAEIIRESGIDLQCIDIPELALRNLCLHQDLDCYFGLLIIGPSHVEFVITYQTELLLSLRVQSVEENLSSLIPEIARAFTYCNNQLQKALPKELRVIGASPAQIVYLSATAEDIHVLPYSNTQCCHGKDALELNASVTQEEWIAVGGALRTI